MGNTFNKNFAISNLKRNESIKKHRQLKEKGQAIFFRTHNNFMVIIVQQLLNQFVDCMNFKQMHLTIQAFS